MPEEVSHINGTRRMTQLHLVKGPLGTGHKINSKGAHHRFVTMLTYQGTQETLIKLQKMWLKVCGVVHGHIAPWRNISWVHHTAHTRLNGHGLKLAGATVNPVEI